MALLKLSERAWKILLVIDEDSQNHGYWYPGNRIGTSDFCKRIGDFVNINGSGDAKILRSLSGKGLISFHPVTSRYCSRITEDGRLLIEQSIEQNRIPFELRY